MVGLVEILRDDARHIVHFAKGFVKGVVKGTYTPYLLTTTLRQNSRYQKFDRIAGERIGHALGYVGAHVFVSLPILAVAVSMGKGKYYLATILATNILDYSYHLHDRSKSQ